MTPSRPQLLTYPDSLGGGLGALGDLLEAPPLGPSTLDFYRDFGRSMLFRVERGEGECSA